MHIHNLLQIITMILWHQIMNNPIILACYPVSDNSGTRCQEGARLDFDFCHQERACLDSDLWQQEGAWPDSDFRPSYPYRLALRGASCHSSCQSALAIAGGIMPFIMLVCIPAIAGGIMMSIIPVCIPVIMFL
jgi:hypothetical protein